MDMESYEGDDFHPSLEPMVIINSQDDEEENNFFLKLQLCRKSDLAFKAQISQMDRFGNQLSFIANKANFDSFQDNNHFPNISPEVSIIPVRKKSKYPKNPIKIKLFGNHFSNQRKENRLFDDSEDCVDGSNKKSRGVRLPVRQITKEEASTAEDSYAKRKSSPLEKCPICKKFFRRMKTHLLKHEIIQNQEQSQGLICEFCNKAFNSQSNLQIHMRTHTGDKPYICEVCQKSFSQSCNLVNHMRIHTGEKPFKCPHCDRAFTQSGNLNNHIRLHTDDKPFKCHFCDKAFVQSGNLSSHIKNNHWKKVKTFPEVTVS